MGRWCQLSDSQRLRLGDLLLIRGKVTLDELEEGLQRQRDIGGRLGENLVALGHITQADLNLVLAETPVLPLTVEETGLSHGTLLGLLLKFMRSASCETLPLMSKVMGLPPSVIQELVQEATAQKFFEVIGTTGSIVPQMRYALTDRGRIAAADAMAQSQYIGPAPVSLEAYQAQVKRQSIKNESLSEATLREGFANLIVPSNYIRKLLPAVSAGHTILLYGPPGNGKTSIGTRISKLFRDVVYIPYAIEVAGQIIKIFDSRLHKSYFAEGTKPVLSEGHSVLLEAFDARWVACRRPVAVAGGELTLDMLDLRYDPNTKLYDAPLHVKALNGLFLIDDFGRQKVSPTELLNRWIVPMESRIDFLTLNSGVSFMIPFDELVVFSTNLQPADLMDPAFLRRIPYKIELLGPTVSEYKRIFMAAAAQHRLKLTDRVFEYILRRLASGSHELAYFQPNFICEQISQVCSCFALPREITIDLADEALENLYVDLKAPAAAPQEPAMPTPIRPFG